MPNKSLQRSASSYFDDARLALNSIASALAEFSRYVAFFEIEMLEPSAIKEYSSLRAFHLRDVSWNSSGLTLHSFGGAFIGDAIDLIFLSTDYIELPFELKGLHVTQPCDDSAVDYEHRFGVRRQLEQIEGKRVFAIESGDKRFHVIAGKLWILTRTHNLQSSLNLLLSENVVERTAFIEQHVKEWYKITALED